MDLVFYTSCQPLCVMTGKGCVLGGREKGERELGREREGRREGRDKREKLVCTWSWICPTMCVEVRGHFFLRFYLLLCLKLGVWFDTTYAKVPGTQAPRHFPVSNAFPAS